MALVGIFSTLIVFGYHRTENSILENQYCEINDRAVPMSVYESDCKWRKPKFRSSADSIGRYVPPLETAMHHDGN
jgi:hypothetical protein